MKTDKLPPLRITHRYSASRERVFDAWLAPAIAGQWLFATAARPMVSVAIDARAGGAFCFVDRQDGANTEYRGTYVDIIPARRLVFTLSPARHTPAGGRVTVAFTRSGRRCEITLTHAGLLPEDATRTERRWTGILYGLEVILGRPLHASYGFEWPRQRKGPIRIGQPVTAFSAPLPAVSNSAAPERL